MDDSNCPHCGASRTTQAEITKTDKFKVITNSYACGTKVIEDNYNGYWHKESYGPCALKKLRR